MSNNNLNSFNKVNSNLNKSLMYLNNNHMFNNNLTFNTFNNNNLKCKQLTQSKIAETYNDLL